MIRSVSVTSLRRFRRVLFLHQQGDGFLTVLSQHPFIQLFFPFFISPSFLHLVYPSFHLFLCDLHFWLSVSSLLCLTYFQVSLLLIYFVVYYFVLFTYLFHILVLSFYFVSLPLLSPILIPCVVFSFLFQFIALLTAAASTSETSVKLYQTTWRGKAQDSFLHTAVRTWNFTGPTNVCVNIWPRCLLIAGHFT